MKKFLSDEKELVDSFIIALTSNYKKSKYLGSSFSDDLKWDFCSEMISQSYNINNTFFPFVENLNVSVREKRNIIIRKICQIYISQKEKK